MNLSKFGAYVLPLHLTRIISLCSLENSHDGSYMRVQIKPQALRQLQVNLVDDYRGIPDQTSPAMLEIW
jgi:hypothetical protein